MKKVILLLLSACSIFACTHTPKWELVWEDNFDGAEPDTSVWSRIPRGKPDWQNTQSFDDRCYEMRNGLLILKGIVNDNTEADAAQYLTGGLWTKDKRAFHGGRIEVRARLHGAKGAWPAIWTLPYETDKYSWPMGGEVDIMEKKTTRNTETLFPLIPKTSMYMEWIFGRTVLYSMSTENETLFILELKPNKKDSFLLISRNIC